MIVIVVEDVCKNLSSVAEAVLLLMFLNRTGKKRFSRSRYTMAIFLIASALWLAGMLNMPGVQLMITIVAAMGCALGMYSGKRSYRALCAGVYVGIMILCDIAALQIHTLFMPQGITEALLPTIDNITYLMTAKALQLVALRLAVHYIGGEHSDA